MRYEKVKQRELKHGDQIAVIGDVADLSKMLSLLMQCKDQTYYHHGIYDANSLEVIHLTGDSKANAKPQRNDFTEFFAEHKQLYRVVYEDGECLPVNEVMERAEDAVNQGSSWPNYDIIENNWESFAAFLKTGEQYSKQVFDALALTVFRVGAVAIAESFSRKGIS